MIAIPIMTRDLHYVFGDTILAWLEALVQRYDREVWEERYAKSDRGKMGPKEAQIKRQKGGTTGWKMG